MKNKHSFLSKILTLCIAVAMLLAVAAPAMADYTAVGVGDDVPFDKYLVMDNDMPVPVATFDFTVTAGTARDANCNNPAIIAGEIKDGNPSIASAVFSPTSTTNTTVQPGDTLTGAAFDPATQKYVRVRSNVDFTGVTFSKPGIYRYVVTESQATGTAPGIANDANTTRYMDVYVYDTGEATPALKVSYVMFHTTEAGIPTNAGTPTPDTKNKGFTNRYTSYQLTLNKTVSGNQGNRDEYFKFVVEIDGSGTTPATPAGTKYTVALNEGAFGTGAGETNLNAAELTTDTTGKVTGTYFIKHGQTITIKGLTAGTKYTITEYPIAGEGYTTKYTVDAGAETTATTTGAVTVADDDAVVFTNTRAGTVPTGILLDVAPYALIVAFAGMALIMLLGKRKAATR